MNLERKERKSRLLYSFDMPYQTRPNTLLILRIGSGLLIDRQLEVLLAVPVDAEALLHLK